MDLATILGWFPKLIIAGGGGALIAIAVMRATGEKWLENRFNERLEALKHEQSREIERLRFHVAGLLDRSSKLNQREFEVLPDIWKAIDEAYVNASIAMARLRLGGPDFVNLSDAQAEQVISKSPFQDFQKDELRSLSPMGRSSKYMDFMKFVESNNAADATNRAWDSLRQGGLFVSPDVYQRLDDFFQKVKNAVHAHSINIRWGGEGNDPDIEWLWKQAAGEHTALLTFLRERFWNTGSLVDEAFSPTK
jgi:hypothetical protein